MNLKQAADGGGLMWAGLANSCDWIDTTTVVGGVGMTQTFCGFEKAVYDSLREPPAGSSSEPPVSPSTVIHRQGSCRCCSQAGPSASLSIAMVAALPATTQCGATTLTAARRRTGQPVRGLRMCP